ncbi:Protein Y43F8A.5 [Aphelenchoides avenae]|nr:Protein Y43F8A.5 [Aphelenchus avenae]
MENWNATGISPMDCANRSVSSSSQLLQTEANNIFLFASILMTISASLAATVIGKLGDERSRKMALAVPFVGLLVADATLLLQVYFMETSSYWFLLSEAIFGCFGGYVAIFSSSFAYASAMAKNSGLERSKAIARLEGSVGVGSILGFFCTYAVPKFGYFAGFAFMTALHVVCLLCVVAFMQDIRPSEDVVTAKKTNWEALGDKFTAWTVLFKDERRAARIVLLTSCFGLSFFAFMGTLHILFFYLKQRFSWDMEQYATLKAPDQMLSTLAILLVFPFLKSRHISDAVLALIGLSSRCAGRLWLAVAWNTYSVYPMILMDAFSRFSPAALRSLLSKSVEVDQQGRIFSLISVIELVGSLLASVAFHTLFPWSIPFFPQLAFVVMALVMLVPVFLICWNLRELNREPAEAPPLPPIDFKSVVTQGLVRRDDDANCRDE